MAGCLDEPAENQKIKMKDYQFYYYIKLLNVIDIKFNCKYDKLNQLYLTAQKESLSQYKKKCGHLTPSKISHLLSLTQTQKTNSETFKLQKDVINSRVGVAGQQHTKTTRMQDTNLRTQGPRSQSQLVLQHAQNVDLWLIVWWLPGCRWLWFCLCQACRLPVCSL